MDYKKKYEEALERARKINNGEWVAAPSDWTLCETIFPELKESEGERIRKEILEYFQQFDNVELRGVKISDWISWLEKQGEQKLYVNDDAKEMFIKALERVEEQNSKGYKLTDCDKNSWWEDFKAYTSCAIEQKPAWSEEDERMLEDAISSINHESVMEGLKSRGISYSIDSSAHLMRNLIAWLKSLKERMKGE